MASPADQAGTEQRAYVVTVTLTDIAAPYPAIFQERHRYPKVAHDRARQYVLEGYCALDHDGVGFTLYPPHRISRVRVHAVVEEATE